MKWFQTTRPRAKRLEKLKKRRRDGPEPATRAERKGHRGWRRLGLVVLGMIVLLAIGRAMLPSVVQEYVNDTLDRSPLYTGRVGEVQIRLLRGAYSIRDVRLNKVAGNVPVPLFAAERVDFAIQWNALMHGRVVGRMVMYKPELNFVDAGSESEDQTGAGGPWLQMIEDLFPFRINSAVIRDGSIHFRAYEAEPQVDVYLSDVQGSIENLTNIRDETEPLISTVQATAKVMDQATVEYKMALDPFSYRPSFHMGVRVLGLDVTELNDLARAYGNFDFEEGWLDLVIEADAKQGQLRGYAKPLFRDLQVFSLRADLSEQNVFQAFWEALVGLVGNVFKNQPRDQFGTLIPFRGDLSGATTTDLLATIGNILHNAFVRAYLPRLEGGQGAFGDLVFEPPELTDPISVGDTF